MAKSKCCMRGCASQTADKYYTKVGGERYEFSVCKNCAPILDERANEVSYSSYRCGNLIMLTEIYFQDTLEK